MQKYTKIFIIFALLTFTLLCTKFYLDLKDNQELRNAIVKDEAKSLLALYKTFRKTYQNIFISKHIPIDKKTINLLPVRTAEQISINFSNAVGNKSKIKTVSDNPRNEKNRANSFEMNIIKYFKENPNKEYFFQEKKKYTFYYAQPLYITKTCLKCHGKKEDAIKTVREQYDSAYDYKIGDIRGILSIETSKQEIISNIENSFTRDLLTAISVYLLFLIAIYLTIRIIIKNEKEYSETLEKKVQKQINEIRKKDDTLLQQSKMAEMGEMIGNIAHQWRQPLSIISTSASAIKLQNEFKTLDETTINNSMDNIVKNTKYLSQTIDDFRNFVKGDKKLENFLILSTINTTLEILHGTLTHYNIKVEKEIDKNLKITSYPNEITQILINIINNAKDAFDNKDMEEKYIFISVKEKKDDIVLSIKDNAEGIDKNIIKKIFDPYFTTKHQSQGTGLGLFMTHRLIKESLCGNIEVKNIKYQYKNKNYTGAIFKIRLPKIIS